MKCIMPIQIILLFEISQNKLKLNKCWNTTNMQIWISPQQRRGALPMAQMGRFAYLGACRGGSWFREGILQRSHFTDVLLCL